MTRTAQSRRSCQARRGAEANLIGTLATGPAIAPLQVQRNLPNVSGSGPSDQGNQRIRYRTALSLDERLAIISHAIYVRNLANADMDRRGEEFQAMTILKRRATVAKNKWPEGR